MTGETTAFSGQRENLGAKGTCAQCQVWKEPKSRRLGPDKLYHECIACFEYERANSWEFQDLRSCSYSRPLPLQKKNRP